MEGKGYGQPPGSLDLERQEGQGRGDLVCHVAELQRQEWNIVPAPPREAPQLHSPCSPAWGLTRARKVSEIPLHAQASLPPSSARLPMPVFGEQNCQDRESGRIRGFGAEQQGGGGFAGSVCVFGGRCGENDGVSVDVCEGEGGDESELWRGEELHLGGRPTCIQALQHGVMPLSFSCPTERPGGILKRWLSGPPFWRFRLCTSGVEQGA